MKAIVQSLFSGIKQAELIISTIGLIVTTLLIFAQVLNRYWLHFEIMWLGDLALYCFVFFMLVAATVATWREGHVSVDFLKERIGKGSPLRAAVYRVFLDVLSIVILCIFFPVAYAFMLRAIQYPEYGTLVRWFNTSWLQITLFVAIVFVLLHLLAIVHRDVGELKKAFLDRSQRERK